MNYEIHSASGFAAGNSLTVRIPEPELDRKALYTLLADKPDFILPFSCKTIDNEIELIYQTETRSKLLYLTGSRSPLEYAGLWLRVLSPMLECADWFLKPYSFVLQAGHIYCDKNTQAVSYIYIPSQRDCSDYSGLKEMASELAKHISTTDTELENKVLRAIMQDFDPKEFLQLFKPYQALSMPSQDVQANPACPPAPAMLPTPPAGPLPKPSALPNSLGDIVINLPEIGKPAKQGKTKAAKKPKSGGLFAGKKLEPPAIFLGAAAQGEGMQPNDAPSADYDDITHLLEDGGSSGAKLRLIGDISLPREINVPIGKGEAFTIGRFDVSIGRPQSSFEFDKSTKAVSRRHAVIDRDADGYNIIDLSSSAGTFVDGQKLPPNTPFRLKRGSRISFGNAAADYLWEE